MISSLDRKKEALTKEANKMYELYIGSWPTKPDGVRILARNNDVDAFRHAYSAGIIAMEYSSVISNILGQTYELNGQINNDARYYANSFKTDAEQTYNVQKPEEYLLEKNMDLWNNKVGREIAAQCKTKEEFAIKLAAALKLGKLITNPALDSRRYEENEPTVNYICTEAGSTPAIVALQADAQESRLRKIEMLSPEMRKKLGAGPDDDCFLILPEEAKNYDDIAFDAIIAYLLGRLASDSFGGGGGSGGSGGPKGGMGGNRRKIITQKDEPDKIDKPTDDEIVITPEVSAIIQPKLAA